MRYLLVLVCLFSFNTLSAKSLMFKEEENELKRKQKLYKNALFVEGICFVDGKNWAVWINGNEYGPNKNKVKNRYKIEKVTKKEIKLVEMSSNNQLYLKPGSIHKIK